MGFSPPVLEERSVRSKSHTCVVEEIDLKKKMFSVEQNVFSRISMCNNQLWIFLQQFDTAIIHTVEVSVITPQSV